MAEKFDIEAKNDYIIAEPVTEGESELGLAKVESAPKNQYLEVRAIGEDVTACKVGDRVLALGSEFQSFKDKAGKPLVVLQNHIIVGVINV